MSIRRLRLARRFPALAALTLCAFTGCASSTVLQSQPSGAIVKINGVQVGTTPYTLKDKKIVGSTTVFRLEAPGYRPLETQIQRNEKFDPGPFVAGFVTCLVTWLWMMKYKPTHTYTLAPVGEAGPAPAYPAAPEGYPPADTGPAGYPPPPPGYPPPAPTH